LRAAHHPPAHDRPVIHRVDGVEIEDEIGECREQRRRVGSGGLGLSPGPAVGSVSVPSSANEAATAAASWRFQASK
jgi:hypothetical protein